MKKILILFFVYAVCLSPVFSADWKEADKKIYIDTSSIGSYHDKYNVDNNEQYSFWTKSLNDNSSRFTKLEKAYNKKIWYVLSKDIIDCDNKTIANKSIVVYDLNSHVIDSQENQFPNLLKISIAPDSMGEVFYNYVCKPQKPIKTPDMAKINWAPYMRELERRIKNNWNPPVGEASKRVTVMFKVNKDGTLSSFKITESSDSKDYDNKAKEAVEKTSPFKPLPAEFKGNSVDIEFTFDYNVIMNGAHK